MDSGCCVWGLPTVTAAIAGERRKKKGSLVHVSFLGEAVGSRVPWGSLTTKRLELVGTSGSCWGATETGTPQDEMTTGNGRTTVERRSSCIFPLYLATCISQGMSGVL